MNASVVENTVPVFIPHVAKPVSVGDAAVLKVVVIDNDQAEIGRSLRIVAAMHVVEDSLDVVGGCGIEVVLEYPILVAFDVLIGHELYTPLPGVPELRFVFPVFGLVVVEVEVDELGTLHQATFAEGGAKVKGTGLVSRAIGIWEKASRVGR